MVNDIPSNCKIPAPRFNQFAQLEDDDFYILGGQWSSSKENKRYSDVWRYSFKTNRWKHLGRLNTNAMKTKYMGFFEANYSSNKLIQMENNIFLIDFKTNKLSRFTSSDYSMMHYPLLDTTEQYICGVVFKSETYKNIAVFKRTDFLGKPVEVLNIYIEPTIK
jgi:hypothetical protein